MFSNICSGVESTQFGSAVLKYRTWVNSQHWIWVKKLGRTERQSKELWETCLPLHNASPQMGSWHRGCRTAYQVCLCYRWPWSLGGLPGLCSPASPPLVWPGSRRQTEETICKLLSHSTCAWSHEPGNKHIMPNCEQLLPPAGE